MSAVLAVLVVLLGGTMTSGTGTVERALEMEISRKGETIVVTLIGNSPRNQRVEYELELTGASTSHHKGSTMLLANSVTVLSTMRMNAAPTWCVAATVTEQDGTTYEYLEGTCS